jgi:hypothetical protein
MPFADGGGQWRITPCQHSRVDYRAPHLLLTEAARREHYQRFMESRLDDEQRLARAPFSPCYSTGFI